MSLLGWVIIFSLFGGVLSVLAAAIFLLFPEAQRERAMPHAVSFAIGAMLGAAFLGLLPHAVEGEFRLEFHQLGMTVLLGILGFFLMEKMVLWRHCHAHACEAHAPSAEHRRKATGTLILIGDGIHNLVDGVLIAGAFLTNIHLGVITSLAVAAHEIPQEVGDFAVLLHSGLSRRRAFLFNILTSITTLFGAVAAYFWLQHSLQAVPYVIAIAASSFIYIAVADLIPGLHQRVDLKATAQQLILIMCGMAMIYVTHSTLH
ncbi:MAG: ZIP family metal transporter [Gammaproteobacteria bacterium]|nr:ZIP family metal transporter [Gammaproteobacteria bacterium]